jgi:hypothetical protein
MKKAILILVSMLCAGCASEQIWSHPIKSNQAFYHDSARCEAMSGSVGSGQIIYGENSFANGYNTVTAARAVSARDRIYENCMRGEGWYVIGE